MVISLTATSEAGQTISPIYRIHGYITGTILEIRNDRISDDCGFSAEEIVKPVREVFRRGEM